MYAVVTTGGKQYRVEAGSELLVEKLAVDPGASVTFDRVLLVGDGDEVTIGTPTVAGATVTGTVLREERGPKIIIFKFKQKAKYRRRTGHRQDFVRVRIDEISASGKRSTVEATPKAEAKTEPKATAAPKAKAAAAPKRAAAKPKASASTTAEKPKRATRAKAASTEGAADASAEKPKPKRASRAKAKPATDDKE
jgi:large subunit ribosomal protein L21